MTFRVLFFHVDNEFFEIAIGAPYTATLYMLPQTGLASR
jgi:hypothetical protein